MSRDSQDISCLCGSNKRCSYIELIKKSDAHWELVFNRSAKHNAINGHMYETITDILNEAANDQDLILVSITGKGKYYSSGTDLSDPIKAFTSSTDNLEKVAEEGYNRIQNFIETFIKFPKILIAFVNGPALGISVTTLALFDGVYASSISTFSLPFVRRGLSPEGCSSYLFPNLMGIIRAKDVILFDRILTAEEAEQRGLITKILDQQSFEEEKRKICEKILSLPKESLLSSKELIQRWNLNTLKYVNQQEMKHLKTRWFSDDFAQAISTFMNKTNKSNL